MAIGLDQVPILSSETDVEASSPDDGRQVGRDALPKAEVRRRAVASALVIAALGVVLVFGKSASSPGALPTPEQSEARHGLQAINLDDSTPAESSLQADVSEGGASGEIDGAAAEAMSSEQVEETAPEAADTQMADFNYPEMMAPHANFVEDLDGNVGGITDASDGVPMVADDSSDSGDLEGLGAVTDTAEPAMEPGISQAWPDAVHAAGQLSPFGAGEFRAIPYSSMGDSVEVSDASNVPMDCTGHPQTWSSQKHSWCCGIPGIHCSDSVIIHHHVVVHYNCDVGYSHWATAWSSAKQDACCHQEGRACTVYHCHQGFETSSETWSAAKSAYCCAHFQMGCKVVSYSCTADFDDWQNKWTKKKKEWCCKTVGKGCPKTYSCNTTTENETSTWEKDQQDWCCLHYGVGCPLYSAPYSCKGDDADIREWSEGRQKWCCAHYRHGCSKDVTKPFDCSAGSSWSDGKKAWCCHNEKLGCNSTGHFDCAAGFSNWRRGWSPVKREWCCARERKGCHFTCKQSEKDQWSESEQEYCCDTLHIGCRTASPQSVDCKAGYEHWKTLWTPAKQKWCCKSYGRGCPMPEPFDCEAGLANWHAGWSDKKKAHCCSNFHLGCEHDDAPVDVHVIAHPPAHDCVTGYSTWRQTWSTAKKHYCCHKYELGCDHDHGGGSTPSYADPFDCSAGYAKWRRGWSGKKKAFCCRKYQLGCETHSHPAAEPFDCAAGYDNWQHGWSRHKKAYCCQKYELGCVHGYMGGLHSDAFENVHLHGKPGHVSFVTHHHHIHYHDGFMKK